MACAPIMTVPEGGSLRLETRLTNERLSALTIVASDLASLSLAAGGMILVRSAIHAHARYHAASYFRMWPLLLVFVAVYALFDLYPGIAVRPVSELRKLTIATSMVFSMLATVSFILHTDRDYSRLLFLLVWLGALILVPCGRSMLRRTVCRASWWGFSTVLIGRHQVLHHVAEEISAHPERGIKPYALIDLHGGFTAIADQARPGGLERIPVLAHAGVRHAIIVTAGMTPREITRIIERDLEMIPDTLLVQEIPDISGFDLKAGNICSMLTLHVRKGLLRQGPRLFKRIVDTILAALGGILLLPLFVAIAFAIRMESRGRAIYRQRRVGQDGADFYIYKFRTMVEDGGGVLAAYLEEHPDERLEWETNRKLKDDPRITRVGRWLRNTSIDELPQLLNVVRGEMSLVGPRPIVDAEIEKYGDRYPLYSRVLPGMTGLWQVSGRSNTGYEERVDLDSYYVRNWSTWLDIYVLARTIGVVLLGDGAC